ncbi:MAG: hypothetical protein QOA57_08480, partial [Nitrososphaeraceae archaeon]|nr:hypothetical protein [Nitrososphaeraceae archaeon]
HRRHISNNDRELVNHFPVYLCRSYSIIMSHFFANALFMANDWSFSRNAFEHIKEKSFDPVHVYRLC